MVPYIEDIFKDFVNHGDTMKIYSIPALYHLIKTREDSIVLEETQANIYHNFFPRHFFTPRYKYHTSTPK